jgi:chemotaxis methyl-accepting protein methylase
VLTPDTIAAISERLAEHAGLELPRWVVEARATTRIEVLGCSPAEYVALIDSARGSGELAELIEAVRVGESRLFRHRSQIEVLASVIAPALRARGKRAIRVWSAGCAAGEEPYTLAIVLSHALPDCAISIIATDVSAEALARAAVASYPRAMLDHVPERYRDGFVDETDWIRVVPEIAARVEFRRANLLDGPTPRDCDLVWCRNVLIYFTADARRRVIDRLVSATAPDGFVFVGYSESLRDVPELEGVRAGDTVYYVRRGEASPRSRPPTQPVPDRRTPPPMSGYRTPAMSDDRTPPPIVFSPAPPADDTLALFGHPTTAHVTAEISARLALPGLQSLTIDLDGAELLGDDLAPVLRRARAAAWTAGIALRVHATRAGTVRWIGRHGLGDDDMALPRRRGPERRS